MKLPQFTLRAALLALTLIGLTLGHCAWHLAEQRRQVRLVEAAAREFEECGVRAWLVWHEELGFIDFGCEGDDLAPTAARAIGEAALIKRVFIFADPVSADTEMELSKHFYMPFAPLGTPSPHQWERKGWNGPEG